jgi:enamine deaminase RidA (YjgF/YER057c/UK114 family)
VPPSLTLNASYGTEIYKNHFPTGTWLGVKELALPELLIEIEMEVYKNGESNKH